MAAPAPRGSDSKYRFIVAAMALAGALVGLTIGSSIYLVLNPVLENASGSVRELQGLLWNVVPLMTVVGAVLGWIAASSQH
jgi:cell division protein FtsX